MNSKPTTTLQTWHPNRRCHTHEDGRKTQTIQAAIGQPITVASNPISATNYMWAQRWLTDQQLLVAGAGWLEEGGANWSCEIAPEACKRLNPIAIEPTANDFSGFRNEAISASIRNPLRFIEHRFGTLAQAWTSTPGSQVGTGDAVLFGSASLIALIAAICLAISNWAKLPVVNLLSLAILVTLTGPLLFSHIETRYLLPALGLIWIWLAVLWVNGVKKAAEPVLEF